VDTYAPIQRWYLRQVRRDGLALANVVVSELATLGGRAGGHVASARTGTKDKRE
jgi:hypothetical protein